MVNSVERYLTASLAGLFGLLFVASVGIFLMWVPLLPTVVVIMVLLSLILMFTLGVQTGRRRIRISRNGFRWQAGAR